MPEVPQSWLLVLETLAASASPWITPAEMADRLGLDVEEATDMLATLDAAGLISVVEPDGGDGPVVATSPRGEECLQRSLAVSWSGSSPRDRRPAHSGWSNAYDWSNRPRIAATAAGSVVS